MNMHISKPVRPPAWLISNFVLLVIVAAILTLDSRVTHWVIPDLEPTEARIEQAASDSEREDADLDRRINSLSTSVGSLNRKTYSLEQDVDDLRENSVPQYWLVDDPESAIARMSSALAILSLADAYGGQQSTASPQGRACLDYFRTGSGSFTECGFIPVD